MEQKQLTKSLGFLSILLFISSTIAGLLFINSAEIMVRNAISIVLALICIATIYKYLKKDKIYRQMFLFLILLIGLEVIYLLMSYPFYETFKSSTGLSFLVAIPFFLTFLSSVILYYHFCNACSKVCDDMKESQFSKMWKAISIGLAAFHGIYLVALLFFLSIESFTVSLIRSLGVDTVEMLFSISSFILIIMIILLAVIKFLIVIVTYYTLNEEYREKIEEGQ